MPPDVQAELNDFSVGMMEALLTIAARASAEATLRPDLEKWTTLAISPGMFEWIPRWMDTLGPEERAVASDEMAGFFHIGLGPL